MPNLEPDCVQQVETTPAAQLEGRHLPGGWTVLERIIRPEMATGGIFSQSYIVRSQSGKKAFLKALDYARAFASPDPARALEAMTSAYNHERDLLTRCRSERLSRIISALDSGSIVLNPSDAANSTVQYLIFELAGGDVRSEMMRLQNVDLAWKLSSLHNICVAIQQLHSREIAHQDLKPSNVLVLAVGHKLCDLGRASLRNSKALHDELPVAGDRSYAPPELLYGYTPSDWSLRRMGCDLYLVGSMVVFFFTGASASALLFSNLPQELHYSTYSGSYAEVLPFLRDASSRAVAQIRESIPIPVRGDLIRVIGELCNPEPERRGHPMNLDRRFGRLSLERYVSLFSILAQKARLGMYENI